MTPLGVDFDPQDPLIRALRALPPQRAPLTLAPKVMAAVRARIAQPAPSTWFDWPPGWRLASAAGAAVALVGIVLIWPIVLGLLQPVSDAVTVRAADALRRVDLVLGVASVLFRSVWYPLVLPFLAFVTVMTITCATVGAMLGRVALGGAAR